MIGFPALEYDECASDRILSIMHVITCRPLCAVYNSALYPAIHKMIQRTFLLVPVHRHSATRFRSLASTRRFIQTVTNREEEAYLEPVASHSGVTSLVLNRPKAKNAISLRLLKVSILNGMLLRDCV